jgi:hypothetical protein
MVQVGIIEQIDYSILILPIKENRQPNLLTGCLLKVEALWSIAGITVQNSYTLTGISIDFKLSNIYNKKR